MSYDEKNYRLEDFEFVWHIPKANSNLADHGVSFEEGAEVFLDPHKTMIGIRKTDYGEVRPAVVGMVRNVPLLVVYTLRHGKIRIISVRKAHKNERKKYRGIQA